MKTIKTGLIAPSMFLLAATLAPNLWGVTISSEPTFTFNAAYTKAKTITATVDGDDSSTTYYITVGNRQPVSGTLSGTTLTFENVEGFSLGTVGYVIKADDTEIKTGTVTVGTATPGWVTENSSNTGDADGATGSWTGDNSVSYSNTNNSAPVSDNTYTPTTASAGDVVTITTTLNFGDVADSTFTPESGVQAAVRIAKQSNSENYEFQLWTGGTSATWTPVTGVDNINPDTTYTVELTLNYVANKYSVKVGSSILKNGDVSEFNLASTANKKVSAIQFAGTGELTSIAGSYVSGPTYTADTGSSTSVTVPYSYVAANLENETVEDATAKIQPDSTYTAANGINYFNNYALGLNPKNADDKPVVTVVQGASGLTVKLTHPDGTVLNPADNVALEYTLKTGDTPDALSKDDSATPVDGAFTINPSLQDSTVKYYSVGVEAGPKTSN